MLTTERQRLISTRRKRATTSYRTTRYSAPKTTVSLCVVARWRSSLRRTRRGYLGPRRAGTCRESNTCRKLHQPRLSEVSETSTAAQQVLRHRQTHSITRYVLVCFARHVVDCAQTAIHTRTKKKQKLTKSILSSNAFSMAVITEKVMSKVGGTTRRYRRTCSVNRRWSRRARRADITCVLRERMGSFAGTAERWRRK